jgi:hypothetical protein
MPLSCASTGKQLNLSRIHFNGLRLHQPEKEVNRPTGRSKVFNPLALTTLLCICIKVTRRSDPKTIRPTYSGCAYSSRAWINSRHLSATTAGTLGSPW